MVTDHKLLTDAFTRKRFFELVSLAESSSEHVLGELTCGKTTLLWHR